MWRPCEGVQRCLLGILLSRVKSSEEMWLLRYVLLVTMLEGMAFARSEVEQFKAV